MGILRETWDYWTKPGLGGRLGALFGDNGPAGAERVVRPREQIERQERQQTGGGGGQAAPRETREPREPRPRRNDP